MTFPADTQLCERLAFHTAGTQDSYFSPNVKLSPELVP